MDEHIVKLMVSKVDGTARIVNSLILGLLGCLDQNKRGLDGQKMDSQTLILGTWTGSDAGLYYVIVKMVAVLKKIVTLTNHSSPPAL